MSVTDSLGREVAYYSTILGKPCRIMNAPGTPKPKEECQPFTFTLEESPSDCDPISGRYDLPGGRWAYRRLVDLKAQEKLRPKLEAAVNGKVSRAGSKWREMPKPSADRQRRLYAEAMSRA